MSRYDTADRTVARARILASREWFNGDVLDALQHTNPRASWDRNGSHAGTEGSE